MVAEGGAGACGAEDGPGAKVISTPPIVYPFDSADWSPAKIEETSGPRDAALLIDRPIETAPLIAADDEVCTPDAEPLLAPGAPMKPTALVVVLGGTVLVIVVTNEVTSVLFWGSTAECASWPASMTRTNELECMKLGKCEIAKELSFTDERLFES